MIFGKRICNTHIKEEKTRKRLADLGYGPDILTIRRMNFAQADQVAPGVKFDFVLADLGVSSMQIDNPERSFERRNAADAEGRREQVRARSQVLDSAQKLHTVALFLKSSILLDKGTGESSNPYTLKMQ